MSTPSSQSWPASTSTMRPRARARVVLPQPTGPTTATSSPGWSSKLTSTRAGRGALGYRTVRPRASTAPRPGLAGGVGEVEETIKGRRRSSSSTRSRLTWPVWKVLRVNPSRAVGNTSRSTNRIRATRSPMLRRPLSSWPLPKASSSSRLIEEMPSSSGNRVLRVRARFRAASR